MISYCYTVTYGTILDQDRNKNKILRNLSNFFFYVEQYY